MNAHELEQLKRQYQAIVIPDDELDKRMRKAILRGQMEQKRRRPPAWRYWAVAAALLCVVAAGVFYAVTPGGPDAPTPPDIAQTPDNPPAEPSAPPEAEPPAPPPETEVEEQPGETPAVTPPSPNVNVEANPDPNPNNSVTITKEEANKENIVIRTPEKDIGKEVASWQVDYQEDASALTVTGAGVTDLAGQGTLEQLKDSEYISDVYPAEGGGDQITVVLTEPVHMEIYGGAEPDEVIMDLTKPEKEKIYILRTNAYDSEYELDIWKERLEGEPLTVQGDAESGYYLTAGSYALQEDAEKKLAEILAAGDMDLFVEER
ncbi:MAG: hypothetical protein LBS10_08685 [Gracilibacteraceae bacterium]|nr:hypothetical protein [Gracilibacteraceae bacterium]